MDEEVESQRGLGHMASDGRGWDQAPGLLGRKSVFWKYYSHLKAKVTLDMHLLRADIS